ncbi:MAG TPA: hypothetical protein VK853_07780 [Ilumatobacteraceae bacterium]|nr:hypothetical protein [Ilumatobacteraceae bacterium]
MPAKGPFPMGPSSRLARGAIMLAIAALQDERVRTQLRKAPAALQLDRLDPTSRFGQKGIERRLRALRANANAVFPDRTDPSAAAVHRAIDELSQAATISSTMPLNDRRRARSRISSELTRLEQALVDAVLPPDR